MKWAAAALLLTLAACGRTSPVNNGIHVPPVGNATETPPPVDNEYLPIDENMSMAPPTPERDSGSIGSAPTPAPPEHQPESRFIVCPGNPRCPPEGSQPKGGQGD